MFYVKAVRSDGGYTMYETTQISVEESRGDGCNGPGQPPYIKADWDVWLYDGYNKPYREILHVGRGPDHYAYVYVMNERGKTIDQVQRIVLSETHPVRAA